MNAIWKYVLPITDVVHLSLPIGARPLCVQNQHGYLTLWALVDPNAKSSDRAFRIVGTGHLFNPDRLTYIGMAQVGLLVWHVFEVES